MSNQKKFPPAFTQAMRAYERIAKIHGEDSEQARDAFTQAMLKAPDWFKDEVGEMVEEMGLIPEKPSGYSDSGEALYTLADLAKKLEISFEEAEKQMQRLMQQREKAGLSNECFIHDRSNFNRIQ